MVLFDSLQMKCQEQHSIVESGMDQDTLRKGFQSFPNLRQFVVQFCSTLEQDDCLEYFIGMDMTMVSESYIHHFRTIAVALPQTTSSRLDVLHLSDLWIPERHLTASDAKDLSRYLHESLWHIQNLKLTRAESVIELLQYYNLKIAHLDICGMTIDYATLRCFITHGLLCSVGFHDVLISKPPPPLQDILHFCSTSLLEMMAGAVRKIHSHKDICHCLSCGHRVLLGAIEN